MVTKSRLHVTFDGAEDAWDWADETYDLSGVVASGFVTGSEGEEDQDKATAVANAIAYAGANEIELVVVDGDPEE